jgi:ketosteroid isomerase-like protein
MPENLEIVRSLYEAMNAQDQASAERLVATDAVWVSDPRLGQGPFEGRDAVIAFFTDQAAMFEDLRIEVERLFDAGDKVVAFIRIAGQGQASGAPVEISIGHVWTVRDGVAVRGEGYGDRDEALRSAGLSDSA